MGVKIFSTSDLNVADLQRQINEWIEVNENLNILNIIQSQSEDWLTITVLYVEDDPDEDFEDN